MILPTVRPRAMKIFEGASITTFSRWPAFLAAHRTPEIYRALNCALITWRTNRKLSATSPTDYIRQKVEKATLGEPEIKARLTSHLAPFEEVGAGNYQAFLDARARLMRAAITALCDGAEPNPVV